MSDSSYARDVLLNRLADEFAARYRRGERPPLREYAEKYPELADDIHELFPALVGMEQVREDRQEIEPPTGVLPPLEQLGDYRILREIGHGGMGVVYEAEQLSLGRHVALKILPRSSQRNGKQRRRFEREVRAAAKLHHTNIVPVFGVGEHDGLPYYAMQFIQGLGLDEVIEELKRLQPGGHNGNGPPVPASNELRAAWKDVSAVEVARSLMNGQFQAGSGLAGEDASALPAPASAEGDVSTSAQHAVPGRLSDAFELSAPSGSLSRPQDHTSGGARKLTYWQSVARIGVQVAAALDYAHHQGILHRDIKPSNLLLDTRGTVWVTDFGLVAFAVGSGLMAGRLSQLAEQRKTALDQESQARKEERWQRYRANMAAAASALELNNLAAMRRAFEETPQEYRGLWEWRHFHSQIDNSRSVLRPRGPNGKLESLTVSPSGKQIAAWDDSVKLVRLWDVLTSTETASLQGQEDRVALLAYSPDGKQLAAAGDQGSVRLWDVETGRSRALLGKETTPVNENWLGYSPDGRRLATSNSHGLRVWYPTTGKETAIVSKEAMRAKAWFSADGQRLVSIRGNDICLWEVATGRQIAVLGPHKDRFSPKLAISADGQRIAYQQGYDFGRDKNTIRMWDGVTGKEVALLRGHSSWQECFVFSPDGSRIASGGAYPDNTVRLWQASDGRPIAVATGHKNEIRGLAFSPDSQRLVSYSADQTARLWDGITGQAIAVLRGHNEKVMGAEFSPDGSRVLSWCDKELRLWDVRTGDLTAVLRGRGAGGASAFFAAGGRLVVAEGDNTLRIWDVGLAEQNGILRGHKSFVYDVAFSPDGKWLASAAWDGTVRLWDLTTGQAAESLRHEHYRVVSVAFHPDGRQLASVTYDGYLHLWNLADSIRRLYSPP